MARFVVQFITPTPCSYLPGYNTCTSSPENAALLRSAPFLSSDHQRSYNRLIIDRCFDVVRTTADKKNLAQSTTDYPSSCIYVNTVTIGHFQKYHNNLCLPPKFLHKHCFHFLMGPTMIPRENKNNTYAKFWRANKDYYGVFESGLSYMIKKNAT